MGLYDEIRWDAALPEGHPPEDRIFQTKSLDRSLDHFQVTPEGCLLLVGNGWQDEDLEHAPDLSGVEVDFHGDIRLVSLKGHREYLARFTHGTLEWIKSLDAGEPYCAVALARLKLAKSRSTASSEVPQPDLPGCCNILLDLTNLLKTLSAGHLRYELAGVFFDR